MEVVEAIDSRMDQSELGTIHTLRNAVVKHFCVERVPLLLRLDHRISISRSPNLGYQRDELKLDKRPSTPLGLHAF